MKFTNIALGLQAVGFAVGTLQGGYRPADKIHELRKKIDEVREKNNRCLAAKKQGKEDEDKEELDFKLPNLNKIYKKKEEEASLRGPVVVVKPTEDHPDRKAHLDEIRNEVFAPKEFQSRRLKFKKPKFFNPKDYENDWVLQKPISPLEFCRALEQFHEWVSWRVSRPHLEEEQQEIYQVEHDRLGLEMWTSVMTQLLDEVKEQRKHDFHRYSYGPDLLGSHCKVNTFALVDRLLYTARLSQRETHRENWVNCMLYSELGKILDTYADIENIIKGKTHAKPLHVASHELGRLCLKPLPSAKFHSRLPVAGKSRYEPWSHEEPERVKLPGFVKKHRAHKRAPCFPKPKTTEQKLKAAKKKLRIAEKKLKVAEWKLRCARKLFTWKPEPEPERSTEIAHKHKHEPRAPCFPKPEDADKKPKDAEEELEAVEEKLEATEKKLKATEKKIKCVYKKPKFWPTWKKIKDTEEKDTDEKPSHTYETLKGNDGEPKCVCRKPTSKWYSNNKLQCVCEKPKDEKPESPLEKSKHNLVPWWRFRNNKAAVKHKHERRAPCKGRPNIEKVLDRKISDSDLAPADIPVSDQKRPKPELTPAMIQKMQAFDKNSRKMVADKLDYPKDLKDEYVHTGNLTPAIIERIDQEYANKYWQPKYHNILKLLGTAVFPKPVDSELAKVNAKPKANAKPKVNAKSKKLQSRDFVNNQLEGKEA